MLTPLRKPAVIEDPRCQGSPAVPGSSHDYTCTALIWAPTISVTEIGTAPPSPPG